jgi:hypothetical protein
MSNNFVHRGNIMHIGGRLNYKPPKEKTPNDIKQVAVPSGLAFQIQGPPQKNALQANKPTNSIISYGGDLLDKFNFKNKKDKDKDKNIKFKL